MNHLRNPSNFWFALNKLCSENNDFDNKLEIRLSGNIDNKIIDEIKSHSFLKNKLVLLGFLNHKDVINEYANANLLLLLLFNSKSGEGNYPGKIFEYFASKKPILCFGPKESDVKNLLENNYGIYHAYQQQSNVIKNDILSLFNQEFEFNDIQKDKYSRKYLTKNLVNILENL